MSVARSSGVRDFSVTLTQAQCESLKRNQPVTIHEREYLTLRSNDPQLADYYAAALKIIVLLHHQNRIPESPRIFVFNMIELQHQSCLRLLEKIEPGSTTTRAKATATAELGQALLLAQHLEREASGFRSSTTYSIFHPGIFLAPSVTEGTGLSSRSSLSSDGIQDVKVTKQPPHINSAPFAVAQFLHYVPPHLKEKLLIDLLREGDERKTRLFSPEERELFPRQVNLMTFVFYIYTGLSLIAKGTHQEIKSFYEAKDLKALPTLPITLPPPGLSVRAGRSFLHYALVSSYAAGCFGRRGSEPRGEE